MEDGLREYDDAGVERIKAFVEEITGGKVVRLDRQIRWRPAWFADVEVDGKILVLHLRGDRTGNVSIFPDLKREADIIEALDNGGINVPKIYGYCANPPCIVMESIAGTRDFSGSSPEVLESTGRDYMANVAAMHALPLEHFKDVGMIIPQNVRDVTLVGLDAYMPHYRSTKSRAEPLLEFAIQYMERNYPTHRSKPSFIQFDSGQYLVDDGKLTGLFDFEFSMIGDPMTDIATMGMRNSIEPLGASLPDLCRYYEEAGGGPVDHEAVVFHVLQFSVLGTMQFAGTVGEPHPGDPHFVYLQFDLALRRSILLALSSVSGFDLPDIAPLASKAPGLLDITIRKLGDTFAGMHFPEGADPTPKVQGEQLVEWLARGDIYAAELEKLDICDIEILVGQKFCDHKQAECALEAYILQAPPEEDLAIITLLARIEGRRLAVYGPTQIGEAAQHVVLPLTR